MVNATVINGHAAVSGRDAADSAMTHVTIFEFDDALFLNGDATFNLAVNYIRDCSCKINAKLRFVLLLQFNR
jgi:hypothetical protein